jgi:hypothetical protein
LATCGVDAKAMKNAFAQLAGKCTRNSHQCRQRRTNEEQHTLNVVSG